MKIDFKMKRKSIIREVLESYRELPAYKYALLDIYCAIKGVFPCIRKCNYLDDSNDAFMLDEILTEIKKLGARFNESENNTKNGSDSSY